MLKWHLPLGSHRGEDPAPTRSWSTDALQVALGISVLAAVATAAFFYYAAATSPVEVPILMYHYVDTAAVPGAAGDVLTVRTKAFEQQMDFLVNRGYHTVTMEQIRAAVAGEASLPPNPVALTFDDGGLDNYSVAYPILRSRGLVATFFVITAFVGNSGAMTWSQLLEMKAAGMGVESHTERHADLSALSAEALREELGRSREAIQDAMGYSPVALSYPFGRYDQRVIDAAAAAGYLMALTTHEGAKLRPAEIYSLPRVHVRGTGSLKDFARSLHVAVTF
jgi:peptidoglycan/xylan/chitin deacetylase (PgdA/CDA1 family)